MATSQASESDLHPGEEFRSPRAAQLTPSADQLAAAMAWFAKGIFAENDEGPDAALGSYEETLRREPGFALLAIQVAREYLRRGQSAEALAVLKDAAKARPTDFLPPLLIAEIYLRYLQKPDLAATFAQQARSLDPLHFAPVGLLYEIYSYSGQRSRALRLLTQAASSTSQNPYYWLRLAELHRRLPLDDSSEGRTNRQRLDQILVRTTELANSNAPILAALGDFSFEQQHFDAAWKFYQAAYNFDPTLPNLREQLVNSIVASGQTPAAEPLLWELLEKNPHQIKILDHLAGIARDRQHWETLLQLTQRALVAQPENMQRHQETISLLLDLNRPESAAEFSASARQRFPGIPSFSYLEAICLTKLNRGHDALALFHQSIVEAALLGLPDNNADFYFEYAVAAHSANDIPLTIELLEKSIRLAPDSSARARNYLGYLWAERNENLDQAEILIRQALAAEPSNASYLDSLGWVQFRQGKFAEALIHLLRASELTPQPSPEIFDHLAQTYLALGRSPEALLFWQKALQLDPQNLALRDRIETLTLRQASTLSLPNVPLPAGD